VGDSYCVWELKEIEIGFFARVLRYKKGKDIRAFSWFIPGGDLFRKEGSLERSLELNLCCGVLCML
jgi:hypothetical protein